MIKSGNILAITFWSYRDALIQTYTLPYVRLIKENIPPSSRIYLITLEQEFLKVDADEKIKIKKDLLNEGIIWIDFRFSKFGIQAIFARLIQLIYLWILSYRKRIDCIHAWCTPAGVAGYLLSVLTGKDLVVDSFEPHAEPSVETGTWKANSLAFKILFYFEKKQARHAKALIAVSSLIVDYAREKWNTELKNVFIKPALVDLTKFSYECKKNADLIRSLGLEDKLVCVYAGKTGGIYLEDEIFEFIKVCFDYWGDKFRFLMITDTSRERIDHFCRSAGLDEKIIISRYIDHKEIPEYIGLGNFALNPVKMVHSKKCCTSIKDGEYWALGLPVVMTDSVGDDVKILRDNDTGVILESLDSSAYHAAVEKIDSLLKNYSIQEVYDKIRPQAEKHRNYNIAKRIYSTIYKGTASSGE